MRALSTPTIGEVPSASTLGAEVLTGLGSRRKYMPSKYLYDATGSLLFEEITRQAEYYPTRAEVEILQTRGPHIARLAGHDRTIVELGSGDSRKSDLLLKSLTRPWGYVSIDIDAEALARTVERLRRAHPRLRVRGVCADFTQPWTLPDDLRDVGRCGFFSGSTIGNFEPYAARLLLRRLRHALGMDGSLLIGVDLKKSLDVLLPAYDDAAGVTAAFNLNLLTRCNRELDATFDLRKFRHEARYNAAHGRIEMHLVSRCEQRVEVGGQSIAFARDESIHTENSYKYTNDQFLQLARSSEWAPVTTWVDKQSLFSMHFLQAS